MSDSKEYILKRPATIKRFPTEEGSIGRNLGYAEVVTIRRPDGKRLTDIYPDEFDELFIEFDREQLKQQIIDYLEKSEILLSLFLEGREPGKYYTASVDEATHEIAESVLALIVGEQTGEETNK